MSRQKIEALADAIAFFAGGKEPPHKLYDLRNPGGLKAFRPHHEHDDDGYRVFTSHIDGYTALLHDIAVKCSGLSYSGLKCESPLKELVYAMGMRDETVRYIVKFVRKALKNDGINEDTPIKYFAEN